MKFDASKIRAARALLDWGQRDLAERSGVSHMAITNLEQGKTEPQTETIEKIQNAFELAGVVITLKGVEYKDATVTTIDGDGWYLRLLDDVYYTLMDKPDAEFLTMCADDKVSTPDVNNRLKKIRNAGICMRQLVQEGNTYLMGPTKEYRYIPKEKFRNSVSLIYGDKVAVCTEQGTKAIVFKDADLAATWRNIFDVLWNKLEEPKESTARERF
ncbi:MAG: helix-turn-helix domain-containing protein [Alphaproteobacteria bacterium]